MPMMNAQSKSPQKCDATSSLAERRCPVCDAPELDTLAELRSSGKRRVLRCQTCWLEFVDPFLPGNEEGSSSVTADEYLRSLISQYKSLLTCITYRAEQRLAYYSELLGRRPRRILEIGAASGWMVKAYTDRGVSTLGLEIDPQLLECARALGAPVSEGDICTFDIDRLGKFDVVCSSQTLEHILRPRRAMAQMVRALMPDGIVHVDIPNADSWGSRLRRRRHGPENWGVIALPHHQMGYYARTLNCLFAQSGLKVHSIGEHPTDHSVFGQVILPTAFRSRAALLASRFLGHGYLLVGVGRKAG